MKLNQYNVYWVHTVGTDDPVHQHLGISRLRDDYAPMHFKLFVS